MSTPGVLYVVATPLGNLEDITLRALRVLREVEWIAAEDTRHSRKLLAHFGIGARLVSYYDQVERQKAPALIERLNRGASMALVSDAGTPGIADPGYHLIRAAIAAGIRVEAIPGPSAVIAALCVAGLSTARFAFDGFVPARPAERRRFYAEVAAEPRTLVLFETARRLAASLADALPLFGDREMVVVRELTKRFEEVLRGTITDIARQLSARPRALQGEVVLVIGPGAAPPPAAPEALEDAVKRLLAAGLHAKDIARQLARERGIGRRSVYQIALRQTAAMNRESPSDVS